MKLKDILSISGEGGLFKFIAQGKNSIIVEHLASKKRMAAHGTAKVSSLEDIAIFTDEEDMPLSKVFDKISEKEEGGTAIDHKASSKDLKSYFEEVLPDYDRDRVYVSDIKKLIQWYNILHELDMLIPGSDEEDAKGDESSEKGEELKAKGGEPRPKNQGPRAKSQVAGAKNQGPRTKSGDR